MLIVKFISELLPCLVFGYFIGRAKPQLSFWVAHFLINFGVPISLMGLLLKSGFDWQLLQAMGMALLSIGLFILLTRIIPRFRQLIFNQTLLLGSAFGNSGYFGIPVSLALLPNEALSFSIGYDLGATLLIWSLGPVILARSCEAIEVQGKFHQLFNAIINSPASKGLIGALLVQLLPWSEQITFALWIPSRIVIVLALIIVGMRLSWWDPSKNLIFRNLVVAIKPVVFMKLLLLPLIMLLLCVVFGLSALIRNALVLQAATPTAISVLLLAEARNKDQDLASGLVIYSTFISIITVPIWGVALQL